MQLRIRKRPGSVLDAAVAMRVRADENSSSPVIAKRKTTCSNGRAALAALPAQQRPAAAAAEPAQTHATAEPAADAKPPLEKQFIDQAPISTAAAQAPLDDKAQPGGKPVADAAAAAVPPTDAVAPPAAALQQAASDPELRSFLSQISAEEAEAEAQAAEEEEEEVTRDPAEVACGCVHADAVRRVFRHLCTSISSGQHCGLYTLVCHVICLALQELSGSSLDSCEVWQYRYEWRRNEKAKHYHSCDEDWEEGMETDEETFDDYIARVRGRGARRSGWCE